MKVDLTQLLEKVHSFEKKLPKCSCYCCADTADYIVEPHNLKQKYTFEHIDVYKFAQLLETDNTLFHIDMCNAGHVFVIYKDTDPSEGITYFVLQSFLNKYSTMVEKVDIDPFIHKIFQIEFGNISKANYEILYNELFHVSGVAKSKAPQCMTVTIYNVQ